MKAYEVSTGDKVLLLGEGNFSFCKDFIIFNENLLGEILSTVTIVASCRENKVNIISEFKKDNINFIVAKGITVLYNVDATNLKCHPEIKDQKFDKIIFNFPHVGGKMRIDLNRKLLKDFFSSACNVLTDEGCIVVALCDGQGGTEADKKQRNWNDTWQVSEMAAQSDLILYRVENFDIKHFPHYINIGYRSCDKSFHCENAVVHVFRRHQLPNILQLDPDQWKKPEGGVNDLTLEALEKLLLMPWKNPHSASSYLLKNLCEKLSSVTTFTEHQSIIRFSFNVVCSDYKPSLTCQDNVLSLMDIFNSVNKSEKIPTNNCTIVRGLMMVKSFSLNDFSSPPVKSIILLFGGEIVDLLHQYLFSLLELLNSNWRVLLNNRVEFSHCRLSPLEPNAEEKQIEDIIESVILPNGVACHVIHVDNFAELLFQIKDWRLLWSGSVDITSTAKPMFYSTVLFPKNYTFDLGLSVPFEIKERFEEDFYLILWLLAGDIIVRVDHLTTYEPKDRELICYCYRITYKSYSAPLHRKRVIYIHEKIIAKVISRILRVNIT